MRLGRTALGLMAVGSVTACDRAGDQAGKPKDKHAHEMAATERDANKDTAEVQALKAAAEMRDNVDATRRGIAADRLQKREQVPRSATDR